jgi:hypothetical protein
VAAKTASERVIAARVCSGMSVTPATIESAGYESAFVAKQCVAIHSIATRWRKWSGMRRETQSVWKSR